MTAIKNILLFLSAALLTLTTLEAFTDSFNPYTMVRNIIFSMILWMCGIYVSITQTFADNEFEVAIHKQNKKLCIIGVCLSLVGLVFVAYVKHAIANYG